MLKSVLKLQLELQRLITRLFLIVPGNNCKFAVVELFIAGGTPESEFHIGRKQKKSVVFIPSSFYKCHFSGVAVSVYDQ